MNKKILAVLLLSVIVILGACGANNDNNSNNNAGSNNAGTNNDLDITATNFEFDQEEYTVQSGEEVNIDFTSEQGTHGLGIDDFDVNIEGEGTATFTPDEPGEYVIHCSVPCGEGHDDMKSTLIVK